MGIRRSAICYDENVKMLRSLLSNNRFWILAFAITLSVNIAGFVQLEVPSGSLQIIRIEQAYGFVSLGLLYAAIIISPLTKLFPRLPGKASIIHARRAIGVSAFYYAVLHAWITFFGQLNGFGGIEYLSGAYAWSLLLGAFALGVLTIMAVTSFDIVVAKMKFRRWKLLHRLVYFGSIAVLLHVLLIGPHFDNGVTLLGLLTYGAAAVLIVLEFLRIRLAIREKRSHHA